MSGSKPYFKIKPYDWQIKAIAQARGKTEYGLLAEMGTGKTGAMVHILREKYSERKQLMRTLILSPLVTLFNWKEEFKKHSYIEDKDLWPLHKGGGIGKLKLFTNLTQDKTVGRLIVPKIIILNYEAIVSCSELFDAVMEWAPEIIVCDESHYIKSATSKRTKKVLALGERAKYRYIMTGTPILNNLTDIYSQFKFLDLGRTFGKNYTVFRNVYMRDENAGWARKTGYFPKWVPREDKYAELTEKIYKKCIRVLKSECLDLPPLIKKINYIDMGAEQAKAYAQMKRDFVAFIQEKRGDTTLSGAVVAQLAVTKALRLMQIVSGYASLEDGTEIAFKNNPRLDATEELLEQLTIEHKVIIWCSFRKNYQMLGDLCTRMGIAHVFLTGEMNLVEKQKAMESFNTNPSTRVIIANRGAGGVGINLVAASYSIIYSRNFSLGEELQSEARNHRGGSECHEKIVQISLCCKETIDEHVVLSLTNKHDVSKTIIDTLTKE